MSIGKVAPAGPAPSAPPTAWTIRPQLGSPPCSAALTKGELATAPRGELHASLLAAVDDHARDALGALAVGDHQDRQLAHERVECLAEAQLVLALGATSPRSRPSRSERRCRWWRAGRRRCSGRRSTRCSFDRCTVDGQLSTNDTAVLIASGESGVRIAPESEDELRFGEALDALMRQLAILMVADGEGAGRIGHLVVYGGDQATVELAARAVANSPLVKTALHGADPNWGRIVQAVGGALGAAVAPLSMDISLQGTQVCSASVAVPYDEPALTKELQGREIDYEITLPGDGAETEVFFSDLSHEYVTINADYTT